MRAFARLLPWFVIAPVLAQRGDRAGEEQTPIPVSVEIPGAAPRSAAEEAATLRIASGFQVSLFAAEPLVSDPVAAAFDAAGRMWVVEMRGYMNDLDARDERAPIGRIVVLTDRDGDGVADASVVFADGLVLPRAVLPLRGGALVVAPPELLWMPDADGDLRADARSVVMGGFEAGIENPEHSGNGLLWGFDHRIHLANDARLVRWTPAGFVVEPGAGGGQWGITHDDRGRLYFDYNEDWLRCDLVPGRYGPGAQRTGGLPQLNHEVCRDHTVWPIRRTPGVNRGYQPGRLVDWVLAIHTAVCAPHVYRGDALPANGDVFVCEPAGNVVRRIGLQDHDGELRGANVYEAQRAEFLASLDERFRPVSLLTGLDGALYVVDMYRGVIQHKNFVTSFLRRQIEARGLEQPIGLGRIWRITAAGASASERAPDLAATPAAALVDVLASTNGALRDLALRELVQRGARELAEPLRARLRDDPRPAVRIVLLSALAGLDRMTATDVRAALRDADPGVLAMGLQHAAPALAGGDTFLWLALERLLAAPPAVTWQLALTVGDVLALPIGDAVRDRARATLVALLLAHPDDARLRAAVAAAAGAARTDELVPVLQAACAREAPPAVLRDLAGRAAKMRQPAVENALLAWAAAQPRATAQVVLTGVRDALPRGPQRSGSLPLVDVAPLARLAREADGELAALANELLGAVVLQGDSARAEIAQLTAAEQQRVRDGERVYARSCAACHQLHGRGMEGFAPPLRDSEWVLGPPERLVRIALHGVRGTIDVQGSTWALEMPGQRQLGDDELAAVLSYVRRAFDHRGSVLEAGDVAAQRARYPGRAEPWTATELLGGK